MHKDMTRNSHYLVLRTGQIMAVTVTRVKKSKTFLLGILIRNRKSIVNKSLIILLCFNSIIKTLTLFNKPLNFIKLHLSNLR